MSSRFFFKDRKHPCFLLFSLLLKFWSWEIIFKKKCCCCHGDLRYLNFFFIYRVFITYRKGTFIFGLKETFHMTCDMSNRLRNGLVWLDPVVTLGSQPIEPDLTHSHLWRQLNARRPSLWQYFSNQCFLSPQEMESLFYIRGGTRNTC